MSQFLPFANGSFVPVNIETKFPCLAKSEVQIDSYVRISDFNQLYKLP